MVMRSTLPTPTPTFVCIPNAKPVVTNALCTGSDGNWGCVLDFQNADCRPISDVKISFLINGQFARLLDSGSYMLQPGEMFYFSWFEHNITIDYWSYSIDSWIVH